MGATTVEDWEPDEHRWMDISSRPDTTSTTWDVVREGTWCIRIERLKSRQPRTPEPDD